MSPFPKPQQSDTQADFMSRCMGDEALKAEFPEQKQRTAVCLKQWRDAHPSAAPAPERSARALVLERAIAPALAIAADTGEISGYACTWAYNGDGYQFLRGAFKRSLAERAGKIPLLIRHVKHGTHVLETVGFIERGEEDETGLMIHAPLLDTELAQTVRRQALAGGVKSFSVKATPLQYDRDEHGVIVSREAKLVDVTLTNMPVDPGAEIMSIRSEEPPAPHPDPGTPPCSAKRATQGEAEDVQRESSLPVKVTDTPAEATKRDALIKMHEIR